MKALNGSVHEPTNIIAYFLPLKPMHFPQQLSDLLVLTNPQSVELINEINLAVPGSIELPANNAPVIIRRRLLANFLGIRVAL
jgi:hypothetical protein